MKFLKPKFWDKKQISLFSILLFPIALFIKLLNFFKRFFTKNYRCSIPIICVGNIYLGGTGKTPLCIELFSILKSLNRSPVFIRKKYESFQDEINLLKRIGPTYEGGKRINVINDAIQSKANVAILDDGFQDFSINKNLSIVCLRANCVIINGEKNTDIENRIFSKNKEIKIFYTKYKAQNIDEFKNKKVTAFAGIGNPINFFNLLRDNNIDILEEISFPDHYNYFGKELENLINKAKENNTILLTTEKDFLRIEENYKKNINYLKIIVEIENRNQFIEEIKKVI